MSLINYVEPFNMGEVFSGLGTLIISVVLAYCLWRLFMVATDFLKVAYNRMSKYEILEGSFLDAIAMKKGINLDKELAKRTILEPQKQRKSFKNKLEDQIYEDMFGKDTKKEK